jgi:hypothetical protein
MKTKLAKGVGFPGKVPATKTTVDLSKIVKTRETYAPQRVINKHKYDALFEGVQAGDCFQVETPEALSALARALRLYLKRQGWDGVVRQTALTKDGVPRVWCVKIFKDKK